jgi:hypothetical protein
VLVELLRGDRERGHRAVRQESVLGLVEAHEEDRH